MTQAQLAYELTERGFPFQQQTILKVEKGSRPLRFEEAQAVAEILRTNTAELSRFSEDDDVAAAAAQLRNAMEGVLMRGRQIAEMERDREVYSVLAREAVRQLAWAGVVRERDSSDGVFRWRGPEAVLTQAVLDNLPTAKAYADAAVTEPAFFQALRSTQEESETGDNADG
jgi:hypothetical protein